MVARLHVRLKAVGAVEYGQRDRPPRSVELKRERADALSREVRRGELLSWVDVSSGHLALQQCRIGDRPDLELAFRDRRHDEEVLRRNLST